jgi:hypothetical protein
MEKNELYHHGVKGMKWGVRRTRSADSAKVKAIRKKRVYEMSNQDLKDANNRLNLENQYRDLSKKSNAGRRAVTAYIATAGTITAITAATLTYKKTGKKALDIIGKMPVKNLLKK